MAKSGKRPNNPSPKPRQAPSPSPAPPVVKSTPQALPTDALERPDTDRSSDQLLFKIFWGIAAVGLFMMLMLSLGSGINADDKFQVDYSQKLLNYYGTFGRDTTALNIPDGNMHLYGGFFEVVSGAANKAFGLRPEHLQYHQMRHGISAVLGWGAIVCAALLARLIAGWQAGIFTLLLLLVSPRFVGDSLMNPKDIPFAAGYMMALYNMARMLDDMPRPRWWNIAGLASGLGIALAMRAGGLLPFAILFLFAGLHFMLKNGMFSAFSNAALLRKYAIVVLGTAAAGYVLALLFWPYAMQAPLKNPLVALSKFADLEVKIRVLYEGQNIMSDKTPWTYPIKWIAYTIPLAVLVGFFGSLPMMPRLFRQYNPLWISLALFGAVFPVFYVVYKNAVIHDGWRHLTFAYPPMVVLAGLFWNELINLFTGKKSLQYAVYGAFALLIADAAVFIAANPKFPYVYFNPVAGGVKGAYGQYETDYWGVSVRQGLEWLEKEKVLYPGMTDTVTIATNMYFSAKQLTAKYGPHVVVKYIKWDKRCDLPWDYALYPTRFIDGSTLQKGKWPPDNAVHIVTAGGAPLLAVLKNSSFACNQGMEASKKGDWPTAVAAFQQATQSVPDDDIAWVNLAQASLNNNQLEEAKAAAEKALDISPHDAQASNLIGLYWINKGDAAKAKSQFELALKRESNNPSAWYYLAVIARNTGDNQTALNNLNKAIQLAPNFKPAYELAAQVYEATGNASAAQQYRGALQQMR